MRAALAVVVLAACVDTGAGPAKKIDPSVVAPHLLKAVPPSVVEPLDVALGGGKLVYAGNVVEGAGAGTTGWAPGGALTIKHYWKVVTPPGPGWRVFTLTCHGKLTSATGESLHGAVKGLIEQGGHILIDCADVPFVDSSGLGVLVGLKVSAISKGYCTLELVKQMQREYKVERAIDEFCPCSFSITKLGRVGVVAGRHLRAPPIDSRNQAADA